MNRDEWKELEIATRQLAPPLFHTDAVHAVRLHRKLDGKKNTVGRPGTLTGALAQLSNSCMRGLKTIGNAIPRMIHLWFTRNVGTALAESPRHQHSSVP